MGNSNFLINAFNDAISKPYGYLFLDLRSETLDKLRVRSNIFYGKDDMIVYINKSLENSIQNGENIK